MDIKQEIEISKEVNDLTLNFGNSRLNLLTINGDNNRIEDANVQSLDIGEDVENLTLENLMDNKNSEHSFNGGGANSIKLLGNTTFQGNIKITTGKDIQIRSDDSHAKISGNIWVESGVAVKISVPVSKITVNAKDSKLEINGKIDELVLRKDAAITLNSGVDKPRVEARLGTKLTVKDENNEPVELEPEYILDIYELERYIESGENYNKSVDPGNRNGQVSQEMKDRLIGKLEESKKILNENKNINEKTQKTIDNQAVELENVINEFVNSIVVVNRHELQNQIRRAESIVNSGKHSQAEIKELEVKINKARDLNSKYDVSQEDVDNETENLKNYIEENFVDLEGQVTFILKGIGISEKDLYNTQVTLHQKESDSRASYYNVGLDHKVEVLGEDLKVNIEYKGIARFNDAYISMNLRGKESYVFIEKIALDDLKEGLVREIKIDDTFIPLEVSIPNNEKIVDEMIELEFSNEKGDRISSINFNKGTNIPSGEYNFQYNVATEKQSYALFKDKLIIDKNNKGLFFEKDELALVEIEIGQNFPVNYELKSIVPMHKSLGSITHPKLPENARSIYLTKGLYRSIDPVLILENNDEYWRYSLRNRENYDLQSDKTIKTDDNFRIKLEWINEDEAIDINQSLGNYINNYDFVVNNLDQEMDWLWKVEASGSGYYNDLAQVNAEVVIKANGKEYSKEVNGLRFRDISIKDIIGNANISGKATIEFRLDSLPIDIEAFKADIIIKN